MHVTVPGRAGRKRRRGIRIHRPESLHPAEMTTLDGLPITTPARTLLDLAAGGLDGRRLEAALDCAERALRLDWTELRRLLERHAGRAGAPALNATLARYVPGSVDTRSKLEEIVLELCDEFAIPRARCAPHARRAAHVAIHLRSVHEASRICAGIDPRRAPGALTLQRRGNAPRAARAPQPLHSCVKVR
jgi:hypothetical protein